jgi:hypothetical protein
MLWNKKCYIRKDELRATVFGYDLLIKTDLIYGGYFHPDKGTE